MPKFLFIYGTLRDPKIQKIVFGRITKGQRDSLEGYRESEIEIQGEVYPALIPSNGDFVGGLVIEITPTELVKIDEYETAAYIRTQVNLKSGRKAWVYKKNEMVTG